MDYSHEFLSFEHSLYQDTLVAIWQNAQDFGYDNGQAIDYHKVNNNVNISHVNNDYSNNNNKTSELKFLAKTDKLTEVGQENDDQYVKAQRLLKLLTNIQNNHLTKLSNLHINEDYYKQYEKLLEPGSDRLELYKIIVRDIVLLHGQRLRSNLTAYHHKKIAQDIYLAVIDHKNGVNYANKKNRFTNHDKILIAERTYQMVSGNDWWQSLAKEQIELSNDKLQKIEAKKIKIENRGGQVVQTNQTGKTQIAGEVAEYNDINRHPNNHHYPNKPNQINELQEYMQKPIHDPIEEHMQKHIDKQIKEAIKDLTTAQPTAWQSFKKINSRNLQEKARLYAFTKINEQESSEINLSNHQIRALVVRSLFEITYEKEVTDMLEAILYNANDRKPIAVDQRIRCQIDVNRITKISGHLIEKTVIDNPAKDIQLAKLAKPIILEAIEVYNTRDDEIKKMLKTSIVQGLSSYNKNIRHATAEQLVDRSLQSGFKEITDREFELIKEVALLKQKLTPGIKRKFKAELMALEQLEAVTDASNLSLSSTGKSLSISKNIDACTKLAISKIENLVYNTFSRTGMVNIASTVSMANNFAKEPDNSKDLITQTAPLSNKDISKFKPLIRKEYDKIIKVTMDNYNKALAELRLEQNICQENEKQQIRQNSNMVIKL
jgi:hypothetical protein